ncbi:MAG: dCMP deaminase [Xanthobacteraceae bacterium]|nr:MAG: dCMP deaminase [Xanthobacteraceae bacterium]
MSDSIPKIKYPELFFGFVCPIGADLAPVLDEFHEYFKRRHYRAVEIKVTDFFQVLEKYFTPLVPLKRTPEHERYETSIAYGNQIREKFGDDVLASFAIRRVMNKRLKADEGAEKFSRTVYLIHQFKRKEEIDLLRSVYGRLFFQISLYSRRGARVTHLAKKFASSDHSASHPKYRSIAEDLIQVDENQANEPHGQRITKIFHDADLIVNLDAGKPVKEQVNRFCELLFGSNSISPSKQEYGLYLAKAAALRTLDLSRQVGAAIMSPSGEILALGSNEVPKAGGGTYWDNEAQDDRDYKRKLDSNFQRKREILAELVSILSPGTDVNDCLQKPEIKHSQLMDALEYGRVVHAEMSALSDAARVGHSVRNGILYCTTFPCHMCAKHIVAAGIDEVVFLEPYPKSLAADLHADSLCVEGGDRGQYQHFSSVKFEHFSGVTPRRYREIFERNARKNESTGEFCPYSNEPPSPIMDIKFPFYSKLEEHMTLPFEQIFNQLEADKTS